MNNDSEIEVMSPSENRGITAELNNELIKAPVTYEWQLIVKWHILMRLSTIIPSLVMGGLLINRGISGDSLGYTITGIMVGSLLFVFFRYLCFADKDVHYKLTPLGIIYTETECIPDVAYTVVRIFLGFLLLSA
jgi:hypothetical protein